MAGVPPVELFTSVHEALVVLNSSAISDIADEFEEPFELRFTVSPTQIVVPDTAALTALGTGLTVAVVATREE